MRNLPDNIGVIGIGLIGGSICLGLKQHFGGGIKIFGTCSNIDRSKKAKKEGMIDKVLDIENPHPGINCFIIATPISQIPQILTKISSKIKAKSIVFDVGSTKAFIVEKAAIILPRHISFIGTHPMAGSDATGFENADPNLFRNKPWIVCNDSRKSGIQATNDHLKLVKEIIELLGARVIFMNSKTHDAVTSWASHINLVSSSILINTIGKQKSWPKVAKIASTGFRDTTRLASHDVEMKRDIILTNKENIVRTLSELRMEIDLFLTLLKNGSSTRITDYLSKAKNIRDEWLVNYFN